MTDMARVFAIAAKGGSVHHLVAGEPPTDPAEWWRKPEHTLCGRRLVPLNYYDETIGIDSATRHDRRLCSVCLARRTMRIA